MQKFNSHFLFRFNFLYFPKFNHSLVFPVRPIPSTTVKRYNRSIKIYEKIAESNFDDETWLNAILETANENFIITNFEYRLAENPFETKLWKLYLKYLNEGQPMAMLNLYRRYCRIFIEDLGMKKKYWNFIEFVGGFKKDVEKWWIDCIQAEKSFETFDSAFLFLKKLLSSKTIHPELFLEYLFWFEAIFPNRTCFKNLREQFPAPKNAVTLQCPKFNSYPMKMLKAKVSKNHGLLILMKLVFFVFSTTFWWILKPGFWALKQIRQSLQKQKKNLISDH